MEIHEFSENDFKILGYKGTIFIENDNELIAPGLLKSDNIKPDALVSNALLFDKEIDAKPNSDAYEDLGGCFFILKQNILFKDVPKDMSDFRIIQESH